VSVRASAPMRVSPSCLSGLSVHYWLVAMNMCVCVCVYTHTRARASVSTRHSAKDHVCIRSQYSHARQILVHTQHPILRRNKVTHSCSTRTHARCRVYLTAVLMFPDTLSDISKLYPTTTLPFLMCVQASPSMEVTENE
jgi:hypothetical protein